MLIPDVGKAQDTLSVLVSELGRSSDPADKVRLLHDIGAYHLNVKYQLTEAEYYMNQAITIAELSESPKLKRIAYCKYVSMPEIGKFHEKTLQVMNKLGSLAESIDNEDDIFECWKSIGRSCAENTLGCGDEYADRAFLMASNTNNRNKKVEANILKAMVSYSEKQWMLAYNFLAEAEMQVPHLDTVKDASTIQWLYRELTNFFYQLGDLDQTKNYHEKMMDLLKKDPMADSVDLAFEELNSLEYNYKKDPSFPVIQALDDLLEFSVKNNQGRLRHLTLSVYRSYLIEQEDLKGFRHLFIEKAPDALDDLKDISKYHYYSIKAFLMESEGNLNAAIDHWNMALEALEEDPGIYQKAHGRYRTAQFYIRNDDPDKAVIYLEDAFQLIGSYPDSGKTESLRKELAFELKNTYQLLGDYKKALKYGDLFHKFDHLIQQRQDKKLIIRQGVHEHQLNAKIQEIEEYERKLKHNLQYWFILIFVFILFLALIVISSMQVPKWVIQMISFFTILAMVEFIIVFLDKHVMIVTQGSPLGKFLFKMGLLTFLYPLHHLIEHKVTEYMLKHQLLGKTSWKDFKKSLANLWPWLRDDEDPQNGGH